VKLDLTVQQSKAARRQIVRAFRGGCDVARSLAILRARGLISTWRLDQDLRTLSLARRAGPFVATSAHSARRRGHAPAIIDADGVCTYSQLEARANSYARGLRDLGLTSRCTIGVLCRAHREMLLTLIATGKLGLRVVLLNTGFGQSELTAVVERERIETLVLDGEFAAIVAALPSGVRLIFTSHGDSRMPELALADVCANKSTAAVRPPRAPGGLVLLTSGTTGTPRGADRTRISPLQSAQLLDRIPLSRAKAMVVEAPLFHGTGISQLTLAMAMGKPVVLSCAKFDPARTLAAIAMHRADTLVVVPTMLQRIVGLPARTLASHDTSSLRVVICGGSALSPQLCARTAEIFGEVLYNVYGSTEVANAAIARPHELRQAPGTVGRPPIGCRVVLYDERGDRITEPNRPGTIFVYNPLVVARYTDGGPRQVRDGMVCTGDVGHLDARGLLFVDGRGDDMIVSGGENVYPLEVEHLLTDRPDVSDAAVVAVEDLEFGQRLRAFIVPLPGSTLDTREIKEYLASRLARFKVPRDFIFVDSIPRNPSGKALVKQLRQER
jgi:fatty-acyl-CoA synthase